MRAVEFRYVGKERIGWREEDFSARPRLWPSIDRRVYGRFPPKLQAGSRNKMSHPASVNRG
jgi:hypothetical protein